MEVQTKCNHVKVHSVLSVVSSKPCEPGKFHELSVLDRAMDPYVLHLVLYYKSDPFINGPMPSPLDNLRISLSEALNMYPNVVGRLTRGPKGDSWRVKLSDAGVRMLHADVSVTLDEWLRSADADEERDLTVWEDMPEDPSFWSPFRIQKSNFKCGGLAIGISCNHMQADVTSIVQLVKSWSEVHRGLTPRPPVFQLPQSSITPNNAIPSPFFVSESRSDDRASKTDTVTMKFSGLAIEKALSQVHKLCPDATPYDVLTALLWSRISQYEEWSNDRDEDSKSSLSVCVDARNKGKPVIANAYFGNALHFSLLSLDKSSLNAGLGQVSSHIHQHVTGFTSEDFWSVMSRLEAQDKEGNHESFKVYDRVLTCINTEHLTDEENKEGLMSGAVFDEGRKPVHVGFQLRNFRGQGLIVIMPSPESGLARTVTVTLSEEVIEKLCKDRVILDMEPAVVVSGKRI